MVIFFQAQSTGIFSVACRSCLSGVSGVTTLEQQQPIMAPRPVSPFGAPLWERWLLLLLLPVCTQTRVWEDPCPKIDPSMGRYPSSWVDVQTTCNMVAREQVGPSNTGLAVTKAVFCPQVRCGSYWYSNVPYEPVNGLPFIDVDPCKYDVSRLSDAR